MRRRALVPGRTGQWGMLVVIPMGPPSTAQHYALYLTKSLCATVCETCSISVHSMTILFHAYLAMARIDFHQSRCFCQTLQTGTAEAAVLKLLLP